MSAYMFARGLSGRVDSAVDLYDDIVRRTVLQLNTLCQSRTWQFALAVGEFVVNNLYSGDVDCLRSRRRKDHISLRRVEAAPDLAMSARSFIEVLQLSKFASGPVFDPGSTYQPATCDSSWALAPEEQKQLLRDAEANRWGVRDLEQRVAAIADGQPPPTSRGGPKAVDTSAHNY